MENAISNLNKVTDERAKMINAILYSREYQTNAQFDKAEKRLENTSFINLKKQFENL